MSIEYFPRLSVLDALKLTKAFDSARFAQRSMVVLAPRAREIHSGQHAFHYGVVNFSRTEDALDKIRLHALQARVNTGEVSGIVTPNFISLSFNTRTEHFALMSKIRGSSLAVQGSDYEVQVTGKQPIWHSLVDRRFVAPLNARLKASGEPGHIRSDSLYPSADGHTRYYFPNLKTMTDFCELVNGGGFDRAVQLHLLTSGVEVALPAPQNPAS